LPTPNAATRGMISSVSCVSSSTPASLRSDDQRSVARRSRRARGRSDPRARGDSEGPRRGSQHPAYQRPLTTKEIRRQRATTPIFIRERAPPQRGTAAYQVSRAKRCADRRFPRLRASVAGEGMRSNAATVQGPAGAATESSERGTITGKPCLVQEPNQQFGLAAHPPDALLARRGPAPPPNRRHDWPAPRPEGNPSPSPLMPCPVPRVMSQKVITGDGGCHHGAQAQLVNCAHCGRRFLNRSVRTYVDGDDTTTW
jgi:hypothetical protein